MKDNALAIANYFIDLAQKEGKAITQLGLIKRVYIAHGFSLAIFHKSLLDPRFDKVEAWKYGPVIPSVYHSFKQFKANPITEKTVVMVWNEKEMIPEFQTPKLEDKDAKEICKMVWNRYSGMSDSDMVSLTHKKGSPWDMCYIQDKNECIPDEITEWYYKGIVDAFIAKHEKYER
ncbi:type II toxin-antitoxin system antitoxin SocA domain-containing protein [uncultured Alistipes sp.]|uniref:Panacea domain-containing protein n=1 Tax=uncultured Alistipes sp. TaxID=538949 RepID=UPI0025D5EC64|nr:type II toxin-antitoxin system antitoxin SocA domain-containing protein [uncultured Alistipes sp.]